MTRKEFWIWLAGFLDGEGTITIYKNRKKGQKKFTSRGYLIVPDISIYGTNFKILREITGFLQQEGIKAGIYSRKTLRKNWKQDWNVQIRAFAPLQKFLLKIKPFLRLKVKQAEILEKYLRLRTSRIAKYHKYVLYSDDEVALIGKIQKLNKKGRNDKS